jgi:predicted MPP superfamily phosphohydrolase
MKNVQPLSRRAHGRLARWIGLHWARLSYARFVEPFWLEINRHELPIADLDQRLDGLRILHLTDFHLCARVPIAHARHAVELGNRQQCDIIALTGDYIHTGFRHIAAIGQLLGRLKAPLGVYAVLGNHDYSVRNALGRRRYPALAQHVSRALESQGICVLRNEHRRLGVRGVELAVAGVADLWGGEADLAAAIGSIPIETTRIVLAHNPRCIEQLGGRRCDLMLSGHTHGGQIRLGKRGPIALNRRMREYVAGLYEREDGYLYVNKGIGYTVRFRYQARPEVAVLTLRAKKQ